MTPHLSKNEKKEYLSREREFIEEILEDADDCKWVFQALIELALLEAAIDGSMSEDMKEKVRDHVQKLKALDPLRRGRWEDLEKLIAS